MNAAIVIPSLNPDERLPAFCRQLRERTDVPLLLVDDGSREDCQAIFDECCRTVDDTILLRHHSNRGKGRALKTAFKHLLTHSPDLMGCITTDADGQHHPDDVMECLRRLQAHPNALILGCRRFDGPTVPWRSRFGNRWMRTLFLIASGRRFQDTQTGLRGIPAQFMETLLSVSGERFEFESNMLLHVGSRNLEEFSIQTIYEDDNRCSHFRPIVDSLKILRLILGATGKTLLSFIAASLASFGIDIALFWALHERCFREGAPARLFLSVGIARTISLCFNYFCNRRLVFRDSLHASSSGMCHPFLRYLSLALMILFASWGLTKLGLRAFPALSAVLVKSVVDLLLFFVSYGVQRAIIFAFQSEAKPGT